MKKHFEKMSISQRLVWLYTLAAAAVLILLFLAFEYVERKEIDMYQRAEITSRHYGAYYRRQGQPRRLERF